MASRNAYLGIDVGDFLDRTTFARLTTHPWAPCPGSLTNWYSESTMNTELSGVNWCRDIILTIPVGR